MKKKFVLGFLQMKVPLWLLLLAGIVIIIEAVQIVSEFRVRSEYRRYYFKI